MSSAEHPARQIPAIHAALCRGFDEGAFPGGAAAVFLRGELVHLSACGWAQLVPARVALTEDALFDLASLTKILATTPAIVRLVSERALGLDDPAARYWPAFGRAGKTDVTVRQLLAHCSGLPAWWPIFLRVAADPEGAALFETPARDRAALAGASRRGKELILEAIACAPLERPRGKQVVYSDLGFMALGQVIESAAGSPLERFVESEVFSNLALPSLAYRPLGQTSPSDRLIASTGLSRPREPAPGQEELIPAPQLSTPPDPRPGEVDDDNAFAMGGVAGHAGLFGDARDVAGFGQVLLQELEGASRLAKPELWATFCRREGTAHSTRALGFDTPSREGSATGSRIARSRAVGHNGFTGTSLWIDLDRKLSIALLTNRVHPTRANEKIKIFRPIFHDAVLEALDLAAPVAS